MSKAENLAAQAIGGEIAVSHDYERFDEVMAQGVLDHDAAEGQAPGVEGIKAVLEAPWRVVSRFQT